MYPVTGQIATTAAAMRAAAALIESAGIAGLSVTCNDDQISIQVCEHLGDPAVRAGMVARLATAIGGTAVRADSAGSPVSWIRAEGAIAGLRVHAFTAIPVQEWPQNGQPVAATPGSWRLRVPWPLPLPLPLPRPPRRRRHVTKRVRRSWASNAARRRGGAARPGHSVRANRARATALRAAGRGLQIG
jgi:hypothetical protein